MKGKDAGLIVRAISFQDFQQILIHQHHRRTDDMRSQDHALHYTPCPKISDTPTDKLV